MSCENIAYNSPTASTAASAASSDEDGAEARTRVLCSQRSDTNSIKLLRAFLREHFFMIMLRLTTLASWMHPISTIVFVFMASSVCLEMIGLWVLFRIFRGTRLPESPSVLGMKLSVLNWATPELFDHSEFVAEVLETAEEEMTRRVRRDEMQVEEPEMHVPTSIVMLLVSAMLYEMDPDRMEDDAVVSGQGKGHDICDVFRADVRRRERMQKFSSVHGLRFEPAHVDDVMAGVKGPFCGLFWSEKKNYIIVGFKGTSPDNFNEWLVDMSQMRTHGKSYLKGTIQRGFFNMLFGKAFVSDPRRNPKITPYRKLCLEIRKLADAMGERMKAKGQEPEVNLFFTGHSLGAALATLFYTRLLRAPEDVSCRHCTVTVRDGYVFGSPRVGDFKFACDYLRLIDRPANRNCRLWRLEHGCDFAVGIPLGARHEDVVQSMNAHAMMNYVHIGEPCPLSVDVEDDDHPLSRITPTSFSEKLAALRYLFFWRLAVSDWSCTKWTVKHCTDVNEIEPQRLIECVEKALPRCIVDHYPSRYFYALKQRFEGAPHPVACRCTSPKCTSPVREKSSRDVSFWKKFGDLVLDLIYF